MKKKLFQLTSTAMMIAILIVVQLVTKSFGQMITGSCVNFILMTTALLFDLPNAIIVALVSPFLAYFIGVGTPIIQIVPLIALGNLTYVALGWILLKKKMNQILMILIASFCKFLALYISIVQIVLPLLQLPQPKVSALSVSFCWPQLFTALIGGFTCILVVSRVKKIIK